MSDGTTPLIALDAVVIDSETTALDPRSARVVELAAVRLVGGRLHPEGAFRRLIKPGVPIPPATTRVHGIHDAAVAGAPAFAAVWPEFLQAVDGVVVIGHTVGFDLAVLRRECERAGLAWRQPQTLDTRLLAEVVEPKLADYSLESLASWLGVAATNRHSALGDARAAANVFRALVPKLRERNIRTLAEASRACRSLRRVLEQQHQTGWIEALPSTDGVAGCSTAHIDSYPYRHRAGDIMATARFIAPHASVNEALADMTKNRISSLFVGASPGLPEDTGIITERDIMRALAADGTAALERPVRQA